MNALFNFMSMAINLALLMLIFAAQTVILWRLFLSINAKVSEFTLRVMTYGYIMEHHRGYEREENEKACQMEQSYRERVIATITLVLAMIVMLFVAAIDLQHWDVWSRLRIAPESVYLGLLAPFGVIAIFQRLEKQERATVIAEFIKKDPESGDTLFRLNMARDESEDEVMMAISYCDKKVPMDFEPNTFYLISVNERVGYLAIVPLVFK